MNIFDFKDYRKYLKKRINNMPRRGRGELSRMARVLGIHNTMMSHIMKETADLTLEQTLKLSDHWGLNNIERDYLVELVNWSRAGDTKTREYCSERIEKIRLQAQDLKTRLQAKNELSEEDRAFYYSSPIYSQVRLLSSIRRFQTFEALERETQLSSRKLRAVVDFLVSRNLCTEEGGKICYSDTRTYIEAGSALVARHHQNWRDKVREKTENLRDEDLMFTYPTAMSEPDFLILREKMAHFIREFKEVSVPSPSEHLYCFNLDWVKLSKG
jgi:uncharacterized protein (TIGR02147 family)